MSDESGLLRRITNAIASASNPLKGVWDTAKEINSMNIEYSVKEKTSDLLDKLVDARGNSLQLAELLGEAKDRIIELEKKIDDSQQWLADKENYEPYWPDIGTMVYRIKSSDNPQGKSHYFCTNCYESHVISSLQKTTGGGMYKIMMTCHKCTASYLFSLESLGLRKPRAREASTKYKLFDD